MNIGTKEGAERANELLRHFKRNGISHDPKGGNGLKLVLEWQDLIGKATHDDVIRYEESLPEIAPDGVDRDTFLFACVYALHFETAINIFRMTQGKRWRKIMHEQISGEFRGLQEDLERRTQELNRQVGVMQSERSKWFGLLADKDATIIALKHSATNHNSIIASLDGQLQSARKEADDCRKDCELYRRASNRWGVLCDLVKQIMADIDTGKKELSDE